MQHLVGRWGTAADRRPALLHPRQRAEHLARDAPRRPPDGATMDEMRDKIVDYAARDQERRPGALVVGPEEWGWSGYFYSGYDQQYGGLHGWGTLPDRIATAARTTCRGSSTQLRQRRPTAGRRLLDVFTVHYYPQGGEFSDDVSTRDAAAAQPLDALALGPELRRRDLDQRSRAADPAAAGLGETSTTRARRSASPSTTGAPKATSTAPPPRPTSSASSAARASTWRRAGRRRPPSTPTYKAIKMYRNYDGSRSTFGDTSVARRGAEPRRRLGVRGRALERRRAHGDGGRTRRCRRGAGHGQRSPTSRTARPARRGS